MINWQSSQVFTTRCSPVYLLHACGEEQKTVVSRMPGCWCRNSLMHKTEIVIVSLPVCSLLHPKVCSLLDISAYLTVGGHMRLRVSRPVWYAQPGPPSSPDSDLEPWDPALHLSTYLKVYCKQIIVWKFSWQSSNCRQTTN